MAQATTRDDIIALLEKAGISRRAFARNSIKSLDELCEEVEKGEAVLRYNEETGRIERHAKSVKIVIEANGWELRETGRIYFKKERQIKHPLPKDYATSETVQPHEVTDPILTIIRCLREEWGMSSHDYTCVEQFIGGPEKYIKDRPAFKGVLYIQDPYHALDREPDVHASKAYFGLESHETVIARARLVMPKRHWPNGRKLKDDNVYLILRWFPLFEILETASGH